MKNLKLMLLPLGVAALFAACGQENRNPVGKWETAAPETVTQTISGATSATRTLTFDFVAPAADTTGSFTLTADYDITAPADSTSAPVSYKATASINGTWTRDADDDDDYLLTFDRNSLSVSGVDAPVLGPVTDAFLGSLAPFTAIEDVEVSKDKKHMTFETKNPEVKYHFTSK